MNTYLKSSLMSLALMSSFGVVHAQAAVSASTSAQVKAEQRDVNQQQRIEQGLQSGALNTREAGRIEQGEAHIDHLEAHAEKDGHVSAQEAARINRAQNTESKVIYNQKHDAQTGNPNSASSQRLQQDVQRNANQSQRIANGKADGSLSTREASSLNRGQARNSRAQANAAANGHVGAVEQARIQGRENVQSARIHRQRSH